MPTWLRDWWRHRGTPRTSTLVLSGLFLATLVLYFLVRPIEANHHAPQRRTPVVTPAQTTTSFTPSTSAAPSSQTPSTARSTTPSRGTSSSASSSSSPAATPSDSATSVTPSSPAGTTVNPSLPLPNPTTSPTG